MVLLNKRLSFFPGEKECEEEVDSRPRSSVQKKLIQGKCRFPSEFGKDLRIWKVERDRDSHLYLQSDRIGIGNKSCNKCRTKGDADRKQHFDMDFVLSHKDQCEEIIDQAEY